MTPYFRRIRESLYGVGRAQGRRAVYSATYAAFKFAFKASLKQGSKWAMSGGKALADFVKRATAAIGAFGEIDGYAFQLWVLGSRDAKGPLRLKWEHWSAAYKPLSIITEEFIDWLYEYGDHEDLDEENFDRSAPVRAHPEKVIFRACSGPNHGHGLPDGEWRNSVDTPAEKQREKRREKRKQKKAPKRAAPVKGSAASVRAAFAANPSITNAQAYALFPNIPQPSIRRELNALRKG